MQIESLKTEIYSDGADLDQMREMNDRALIKGLTTNPTLMRQAGVEDYISFCEEALTFINVKPLSLEVFADDIDEMRRQALILAELASNVSIKIPVINSQGDSTSDLTGELTRQGLSVNVTAIMTLDQVKQVLAQFDSNAKGYISIFAGRIADTGIDPKPIMRDALSLIAEYPNVKLIWASTREPFNVIEANDLGVDIITVPPSLLNKLENFGKSLEEFSRETVEMFKADAQACGYHF